MAGTFTKPATGVLDYRFDYETWLNGDTISTSSWTVPDGGITVETDANTTTTATAWISGGEVGRVYRLVNTIETAGGRTNTQVMHISVVAK